MDRRREPQDELLGRPLVDLDIACREPEAAAPLRAALGGRAVSALRAPRSLAAALSDERTVEAPSERHPRGSATRDFTINAIARLLAEASR